MRMGLGGGFYSFRFEMARRDGPGSDWTAIDPLYWPGQRGTEYLPAVLRRAWQSTPPLPPALWAQNIKRTVRRWVGKACVRKGRTRWSAVHLQKKKIN